jgi:hypothetical protein
MRVNYAAIVVSAIVFWIFGWVWYDLLFKNAWLAAAGISQSAMGSGGGGAIYAMVVSIVMAFFLAYGLARILVWRGDKAVGRGAFIGFSMGLLIFGTMTWMDYAFEMRGMILGWINVGFVAIGMAIMGAILDAWKSREPSAGKI